jgi:hypothetical protein
VSGIHPIERAKRVHYFVCAVCAFDPSTVQANADLEDPLDNRQGLLLTIIESSQITGNSPSESAADQQTPQGKSSARMPQFTNIIHIKSA